MKTLIVYDIPERQTRILRDSINEIYKIIAYDSLESKRCFAILLLRDVILSKKIKKISFDETIFSERMKFHGMPVEFKILRDITQFDDKESWWIGLPPTTEMVCLANVVLKQLYREMPLLCP